MLEFVSEGWNISSVFHDPSVSLNFEGFDPQILLHDPQNLLFTFFNLHGGGHCDPLNRKLRENPAFPTFLQMLQIGLVWNLGVELL